MRGTLQVLVTKILRPRFIPAHAGNTILRSRHIAPTTVHPRTCGEHLLSGRFARSADGSSPHMRGTRWIEKENKTLHRFIPAHAGNTINLTDAPLRAAVHPRTCGEHTRPPRLPSRSRGSSPHMRGTPGIGLVGSILVRFIPAHAGNTKFRSRHIAPAAVHPRTCGEHHGAICPLRDDRRFIPAHAGNTDSGFQWADYGAVHPRTCGEHSAASMATCVCAGSSPHMRGTLEGGKVVVVGRRFIPAHAGNTPMAAGS